MSHTYWTTSGDIRGCCGHKHQKARTALECLDHDRRGCQEQGGYSDRHILHVDPLSDSATVLNEHDLRTDD